MNDSPNDRLVLPGELLGTAEEFVPGRGTYEDGGRIYAALLGHARVDPKDRAVRVEALNAVPEIKEGDLVFARVDEVKSAMAVCTIIAVGSSKRTVPGAPEGTVHISKAKDGYTDTLADEFQPGDVIQARVLQTGSSIKLSTATLELGVVSARCQVCHAILTTTGKELTCPRCGHRERRKLAGVEGSGGPTSSGPPPDRDRRRERDHGGRHRR
ncbi:MAG: exosome complex RNA-binding protein Csl4 [Thermoplasmata archaeon]|nr:exosome complex RNA-binding protein Csl4 [Thermoplasmata archaeon]MCI4344667.1 exosome complex RNA-binding protein Csl4 [Thermoplasmata archaeon]